MRKKQEKLSQRACSEPQEVAQPPPTQGCYYIMPLASVLLIASAASLSSVPPHLLKLRAGAHEGDLVDSLSSLKELLDALTTKVRSAAAAAPAPSPPPLQQQQQQQQQQPPLEPELVDPVIGNHVRVRPGVEPAFEWGDVLPSSVGRLIWFQEDRCTVDFPTHSSWNGLLSEMERRRAAAEAPGADPGRQRPAAGGRGCLGALRRSARGRRQPHGRGRPRRRPRRGADRLSRPRRARARRGVRRARAAEHSR